MIPKTPYVAMNLFATPNLLFLPGGTSQFSFQSIIKYYF